MKDAERSLFEDLLAEQRKIVALLKNAAQTSHGDTKKKDRWDKLATLFPFLSSVFIVLSSLFIASIGWHFTNAYNERTNVYNERQNQRNEAFKKQELGVAQIQTLEKFMPYLLGDEKSQRLAILAINWLGNTELAANVAKLYTTDGTSSALASIARSDEPNRAVAADALMAILSKNRQAVVYVQLQVESENEDRAPVPMYGHLNGLLVTSDGYIAVVDYLFTHPELMAGRYLFDQPATITTPDGKTHAGKLIFPPDTSNLGVAIYKIEGHYTTPQLAESPPSLEEPLLVVGNRSDQPDTSFSDIPLLGYVEKIEDHYLTVELTTSPKQDPHLPVGGTVMNAQGQIVGLNTTEMGQNGNTAAHLHHPVYIRSDAILALLNGPKARP